MLSCQSLQDSLYLKIIQMYRKTNVNHPVLTFCSDNKAKCRKSVQSYWIKEKLLAPNSDRLTKIETYQKKGEMRRSAACIYFVLCRKVGFDLLCVVEKVLATRGLGVPADKMTGRELRLQTMSHLLLFPLVYSISASINVYCNF